MIKMRCSKHPFVSGMLVCLLLITYLNGCAAQHVNNKKADMNLVSYDRAKLSRRLIVVHGNNYDGTILVHENYSDGGHAALGEKNISRTPALAWTPSLKDVEEAERTIKIFLSAKGHEKELEAPLPEYVRRYFGIEVNDHKVIQVTLELWRGHKNWREERYLKKILPDGRGEGTAMFVVNYDIQTKNCFDYQIVDIGY